MSDGFLSRWSRRKRQVEGEQAPPAPASPDPPGDAPLAEAGGGLEAREPDITPEELALLPAPDDLTAGTDITAFLRRGVPRALRDAALRRAWALDPMVRDFVCEAREYAYDWNVPGGVPGNGELLPTDDVAGMLRGIFGDPTPGEDSASALNQPDCPEGGQAEPEVEDAVSHSRQPSAPEESGEASFATTSNEGAPQQDVPASDLVVVREIASGAEDGAADRAPKTVLQSGAAMRRVDTPEAALPPPAPRRHGRATPI